MGVRPGRSNGIELIDDQVLIQLRERECLIERRATTTQPLTVAFDGSFIPVFSASLGLYDSGFESRAYPPFVPLDPHSFLRDGFGDRPQRVTRGRNVPGIVQG